MAFSYDENQTNQISNLANGVISILENQGPAKIEKNYQDELLMKVLITEINFISKEHFLQFIKIFFKQ